MNSLPSSSSSSSNFPSSSFNVGPSTAGSSGGSSSLPNHPSNTVRSSHGLSSSSSSYFVPSTMVNEDHPSLYSSFGGNHHGPTGNGNGSQGSNSSSSILSSSLSSSSVSGSTVQYPTFGNHSTSHTNMVESSSFYPAFTKNNNYNNNTSSSTVGSSSSFLSLASTVSGNGPVVALHRPNGNSQGSNGSSGLSTVDSQLSLHSLTLSDSVGLHTNNNNNTFTHQHFSNNNFPNYQNPSSSSFSNNNNTHFNRSIPVSSHAQPNRSSLPPPLPSSNSSSSLSNLNTNPSTSSTSSSLFPSSPSSSTNNPIYGSLLTSNDIAALESIGFNFDTPSSNSNNNNNNNSSYSSSFQPPLPSNPTNNSNNPSPHHQHSFNNQHHHHNNNNHHHHHHHNNNPNNVNTGFTASGLPETTPLPPHHLPHNGPSSKTKICRYYLARANNHFGKTCSYVHPCRNIIVEGHCRHGRRCTDDHICREFLFFGETTPHGCRLGDNCRYIHIRQEVDRLFLIEMFRDWIAVKRHEAVAANQLGSSSAAIAAVQSEVMLAAQHMGANTANRMPCPFWYTDTMAGCKAGPECVYEHRGQFQLPTRPLPNPSQIRFAERSWEKRRQQESLNGSTINNNGLGNGLSGNNGSVSSSLSTIMMNNGTNNSTVSTNDLFNPLVDFTSVNGNGSITSGNVDTLLHNLGVDNSNSSGSSTTTGNNNNIGLDMYGTNSPTTLSRISSLTALDSAVAVAAANLAATAANAAAVARAHGTTINFSHVTAALSGVNNVLQNEINGSHSVNNTGSPLTSTTPTSMTPVASRLHLNLAVNNNSTNVSNANSSPAPDMSPLLQPSPLLNAILTRSTEHVNSTGNNSSPSSSSPYLSSNNIGRIPSNNSLAQLAAQAHAQAAVQTLHKNTSYETLSKLAIHQAQQQQLNSSSGGGNGMGIKSLSPSTSYSSLVNRTNSGSNKNGSSPLLFSAPMNGTIMHHEGLLHSANNGTNISLVSNNAPLPPPIMPPSMVMNTMVSSGSGTGFGNNSIDTSSLSFLQPGVVLPSDSTSTTTTTLPMDDTPSTNSSSN